MLTLSDLQRYKFPVTTAQIHAIVSIDKPNDIDISVTDRKEEFFRRFIQQVNVWLEWFDKFIDIFHHITEWLKTRKLQRAEQLLNDIHTIKKDSMVSVIKIKTIIQDIVELLKPFKNLHRLCDLFNCMNSFENIDSGTLSNEEQRKSYIEDLKTFHTNNTFTVNAKTKHEHCHPIGARRVVRWSLACEKLECNINIEYRINTPRINSYTLFSKEKIPLDKKVLRGEFKTQRDGDLIITINNQNGGAPRTIWYQCKTAPFSTCHLFDGIFFMLRQQYFEQSIENIKDKDLSDLIDKVFSFIDRLLNGDITLQEMDYLKTVFHDKNIDVKEEVKILFANRLIIDNKRETTRTTTTAEIISQGQNDQKIEQVCEWLRTYQYYSYLNIIIDCVQKFDIILNSDKNDESIDNLQEMNINENCSLKKISETYKDLYERFQKLTNHHLQLIKAISECSHVVQMIKKFDLYSTQGLRRFLELRDNLTTQFQLQERNNMILNSLIISYALCEPFVRQVENLEEFVDNLAKLSNIDETSLEHIKVVNENIQVVNMWLSAEATTMLDNALITMEHLYKAGTVQIRLRNLMNEQSYFEIVHSIDTLSTEFNSSNESNSGEKDKHIQQKETIKFTLSMADIADHKRQLTFCNVDLKQHMIDKKILLEEQLKQLDTIEKIYLTLLKLEKAGHPNFQLKEYNYEIYDRPGTLNTILSDLKSNEEGSEQKLKQEIRNRTQYFQAKFTKFEADYDIWIRDLEKSRCQSPLLKLFSNHQVMIMFILLTTSPRENKVQLKFLEKLFSLKDLELKNDEQFNLTILCLFHYLQSLRIKDCNLSNDHIINLYNKYKIEYNNSKNEDLQPENLQKLCSFLEDLFNKGKELLAENATNSENLQFLITLNSPERTQDKIELENDFDMDTCCILLNIFNDRLPADYQILWCSVSTDDDIRLFFSRVRTFPCLTFVVMDIDKMHHRLRELLLNEQDSLVKQSERHGTIYYFSRELISFRKGLRPFYIKQQYRDSSNTYSKFMTLLRNNNFTPPQIKIIYGKAGIGKTHFIKTKYKNHNTSCVSINDKLNLSSLISTFLSLESKTSNKQLSIYFNISIHAHFKQLNHAFFSLFACSSLNDHSTGLTFSPSITKSWEFIIEVPYIDKCNLTIKRNFDQILPILSIMSSNSLEEVTDANYQLFIGEEEELVARFLKAYENQTIDRFLTEDDSGEEQSVNFDRLTDHNECRQHIYKCIEKYAPELPRNKIFELSFTKFLHRRIRFFTGFHYCLNMTIERLGSTTMTQMINEAKHLTQISFLSTDYPRIYLVYDPAFSLHVLHNDWNTVPLTLKALFKNDDPSKSSQYKNKNFFIICLSWLVHIPYNLFENIMIQANFILTENFSYKLFHVHERKLTKLALIIEGETGVGKTFLLKFYSLLLNANVTHGTLDNKLAPRTVERTGLWLLRYFFEEPIENKQTRKGILENHTNLLNIFLRQIESILHGSKNKNDHEIDELLEDNDQVNSQLLTEIKQSLEKLEYNDSILRCIWKTIITILHENEQNLAKKTLIEVHQFVTSHLIDYPLIEASPQLLKLLEESNPLTVESSIDVFNEFISHTRVKPLFYRLLLHPGVTEEQIKDFMFPISQLAEQMPDIELVVFFDEVNTSSCLGLFKEMFMDGTLHGISLPKNIFFTAAINPSINPNEPHKHSKDDFHVHCRDYIVHELPQSLDNLKVSYGILDLNTLEDYIKQKISKFTVNSTTDAQKQVSLDKYAQDTLTQSILKAQQFCEEHLGRNSVSQREIQRCFNLIDFFWNMKYDENDNEPDPIRCIALSLALIYYFRLPTDEDNIHRADLSTPSREQFGDLISKHIPDFVQIIQKELQRFVNTDHFVIPHGVAVNQAIREHIFSIVVSIVTQTPLCIIGAPGQSKTLSFQIVLQNLQGSQLSAKEFCKRLPAVDPFFCLGSKYSRSEDIASMFERAIKREQQYKQNRIDTRCVVFLDEASLPDEKKMVLKVLHPYLDECKVAFVAIANKSFDAANANRMICIYRSVPSKDDQQILAYGCLGIQTGYEQQNINKNLDKIIYGLCKGYRRVLSNENIPKIFHDRDFIYMLRELRFELPTTITDDENTSIGIIKPISLIRALEDNFNGITRKEFQELVEIFFKAVQEESPNFALPIEARQQKCYRDIPTVLRDSMKLDSKRRRLYGRYKLIIDESEGESAINLLLQTGIIDSDPTRTSIFRMSDFPDDINNELRNVEVLSTIKLCMETGRTILMVNTSRIHGSLYDVFNQNFSIMATGDMRKIFSKVAIGPKTIDVAVHEDFQCIVHVKRREFKDIPAPFLSRFQKYSLSVNDFYRIRLHKLPGNEQVIVRNVEEKVLSFIEHFGRQYFYGINKSTLYSCLLSLIKVNENEEHSLLNVNQHYTQLTFKLKSFIEQNPTNTQQCLVRLILSRLIQLVSPESIIVKLPAFEEKVEQWLCNLYFQQQEHFNLGNFIRQLISKPLVNIDNDTLSSSENTHHQTIQNSISATTKVILFTRTSSYVIGLNQQSKNELFTTNNNDDEASNYSRQIEIINLNTIENSVELQDRFNSYTDDDNKNVLIIIIDGRNGQQRLHIPFVQQLIDKTESSYRTAHPSELKYFLMLVHSSTQDLYHQSCFPSIFLHEWEFYFFDTCTPGSAFHLQKMLRIISSSSLDDQQTQNLDNVLCDLNILFEDSLWDFCSRVQLLLPQLSENMFTDTMTHEFYQPQTNAIRRVKCLKHILHRSTQLKQHIVNIYHKYLLRKENSSKKIYSLIYQISKDILCGKRFDGLIESIQSQTRNSFTNFASNVFKFIVNDYGLETLPKLSTDHKIYGSLLNLIDYQSFSVDDDKDIFSSPTTQGVFQLSTHYPCIPQTPLYYLFHQRVKKHADDIKETLVRTLTKHQGKEDGLRDDYYDAPQVTTADCSNENENEMTQYKFEQYRIRLIDCIVNDNVLADTISERIVQSYSTDLIRTFCSVVENNFDNNPIQCQQAVEFMSRWLLLIDDNDRQSLESYPNKDVWFLAHVYTLFEYEQNDLISMYSAFRIITRISSGSLSYDNLFDEENITRSYLRETFFCLIFNYLWENLNKLCTNNENYETWIYAYTFISKYYPSEKILRGMQLSDIKSQLEFMNLSYLIFLNDTISEPHQLITILLKETNINRSSVCLRLLPKMADIIYRHLTDKNIANSTLFIDLQQWAIALLKSIKQPSKQDIYFLLKYIDQSTCPLSLAMKQFLFDELINILLQIEDPNKQYFDIWDRFKMIPHLIECISNVDLENYKIPYHPSIVSDNNDLQTRQILFDLYFFHLRCQMTNESITTSLINKGMLLRLPTIQNRRLIPIGENLFKQLKDYLRIKMIALLLCEIILNKNELDDVNRIMSTIINEFLLIDEQSTQFNNYLELFLSTIISKKSWNFLLNLLKSENILRLNHQWATNLYRSLELKQTQKQNKYLQFCHQIQFTLSLKNDSSIFPGLHQPYEELSKIIDICVKSNTEENQWGTLSDWIQLKLNSDPIQLQLKEIKVILLLIIYYEYYCNNQLSSINTLLEMVENTLQLSSEELRLFRVIIRPEQFMIGYPRDNNNNADKNFINGLFKLDCNDEFDLSLRHMLVNLMAMILLGGEKSFLWTFMFQPLTLENTFGFGSTSRHIIESTYIHYDCGCIISQNGDLLQFKGIEDASGLNVPAAWHLLLFDESVENLYGPILAPSAIGDDDDSDDDDDEPGHQLAGESTRAKVCHFVCTRLLSTFHFLSTNSNQNDACIILTRCFEQMAFLTKNENSWIKSVYTTNDDEIKAEQEYKNNVFYFVYNNLVEHKAYINQLNLQSQIQMNLQNFIDQMPIIIQFTHFKTELNRLTDSEMSLKILQHTLTSLPFLKITKLIYHLSQFYLLLHQTYAKLIERDEFLTITLQQLYDRGQIYYNNSHQQQYQNEDKTHRSIIENGIEAVNLYHQFSDGHIRPGACDQTQRFSTIEWETPVNYLVTNENYDEGDIVMRIISVLVNYHNNLLNLMENELNKNENHTVGSLRNLIKELTSKTVSILQVANDNTGVINLNEKDCLWIEQLCQASFIDNEEQYFITSNSRLMFNFVYIQSQIIRTSLLFCRINYRHIMQKYQWHTNRKATTTDNERLDLDEKYLVRLSDEQLENEWNYLKDILLDKLYHTHKLLRQIALTLKTHQNDFSSNYLFEFVRMTDKDNDILQRLEQYEIIDFQLCYIDHVIEIYGKSVCGFQHLFTDIPPLLRVGIESQLNHELIKNLNENILNIDYHNDVDKIQITIQTITEFLNDLKAIEDTLLQQSAQSLIETCEILAILTIDNPIRSWIPHKIKCENYVDLYIHLIRTRSKLQEQKFNIEEQKMKLWDENLNSDEQQDKQGSRLHQYIDPQYNSQISNENQNSKESTDWKLPVPDANGLISDFTDKDNIPNIDRPVDQTQIKPKELVDKDIQYTSLMTFNLKSVPCTSSVFFQQIHKYREEPSIESAIGNKAQKFTIVHPNRESKTYLWRFEKFSEELKKLFVGKKYDHNLFVVVDKNEIFVDFTKDNYCLQNQSILEYHIIEKQFLIQIQFQFRAQLSEYFTTSKCTIPTIVHHFIDDKQLKNLSTDTILCFYDEYGKCIADGTISDLPKADSKTMSIFVTAETSSAGILYECALQYNKDQNEIMNLFYPTTQWQQINLWLKTLSSITDPSINDYAFLIREKKLIIDDNQIISSTINQTESTIIDIINRNMITKVMFTFETHSQSIYALKAMPISSLLNKENILEQLNLTDISPDACLFVLKETDEQVLTKDDLQKSVGTYSTIENESIHFQISISLQITKYDDKEQIKIPIPNRNLTIEQLLNLTEKSIDVYKYLATYDTKIILNSNEILSNLNKTQFILVKENETCLVSIKKSNDLQLTDTNDEENEKFQRFTVFATIANVNKENQLDILHQYLLYSNDFVPSTDIQLTSLKSESPIQFRVIDQNLPVTVSIENGEEKKSIQFNCSLSITMERLCAIACQIFCVNEAYYRLAMNDDTETGDDISLEDIDENMTEIQFQIISTASLHCSIMYSNQNVSLPCHQDTPIEIVVKETLQKLHMSKEDMNLYELIALDDDRTQIGFDLSVNDIKELLSIDSTTISLELKKIDE
ncbi:unnamed protein product [Rotaria socialis]|uniref:Uncharacterized protein n=1 Tax=Rotaria socialis TaxID=392032 RepID=A0A820HXK3_9BILA|nr:unnamed protein product [Rotaria socialis]CAF4157209.1 unnamed protein product [Rotaria socialis]CAF4298716.1 unnamed protein product [Rotaria socialis]